MKQGVTIFTAVLAAIFVAGAIYYFIEARAKAVEERKREEFAMYFKCKYRLRTIMRIIKTKKEYNHFDLPENEDALFEDCSEIRKDPWGNNFIYKTSSDSAEGYFLYSAGPNGKDENLKGDDINAFNSY